MKRSEGNELVLNAFAGFCYGCKKKGHKAHKCPDKKYNNVTSGRYKGGNGSTNGNKFQGKCNNCGKPGQKFADCWAREENKDKCFNWNKKKEQANVSVDNDNHGWTKCQIPFVWNVFYR